MPASKRRMELQYIVSLQSELDQLTRQLQRVQHMNKRVTGGWKNTSKVFAGAEKAMVAGGAAVAVGLGYAVKTTINFDKQPITVGGIKAAWPVVIAIAFASIAWARAETKISGIDADRERLIRVERLAVGILCELKPTKCADAMAGIGP